MVDCVLREIVDGLHDGFKGDRRCLGVCEKTMTWSEIIRLAKTLVEPRVDRIREGLKQTGHSTGLRASDVFGIGDDVHVYVHAEWLTVRRGRGGCCGLWSGMCFTYPRPCDGRPRQPLVCSCHGRSTEFGRRCIESAKNGGVLDLSDAPFCPVKDGFALDFPLLGSEREAANMFLCNQCVTANANANQLVVTGISIRYKTFDKDVSPPESDMVVVTGACLVSELPDDGSASRHIRRDVIVDGVATRRDGAFHVDHAMGRYTIQPLERTDRCVIVVCPESDTTTKSAAFFHTQTDPPA